MKQAYFRKKRGLTSIRYTGCCYNLRFPDKAAHAKPIYRKYIRILYVSVAYTVLGIAMDKKVAAFVY